MEIRKLYTAIEETIEEMGQVADEPLRKVAAIAVVERQCVAVLHKYEAAEVEHRVDCKRHTGLDAQI